MSGAGSRSIVQGVVLVVAGLLFAVPLVASASFGFTLPAEGFTLTPIADAVADSGFGPQVLQSLALALLTTIASFALLIPTLVWLHLRARRWLPIAEALSVIPFVVPAVALVNGANLAFRLTVPGFLTSVYSLVPFYVILTLPLVYRALDTGLRAIDLNTLVTASASLGSGPIRTFFSIILPNLRPALLTAALLSFTMVLGEYVLATLLLHNTFPVFLVQIGQDRPRAAAALSLITIVGTWLMLSAFTGRGLARRRRGPAAPDAAVPVVAPILNPDVRISA
ncbi:ABC transporter permease subunit [Cryobacterium melibiosiphilum]|uniref:ABC transporter permease subunit n=1 Tax=Cryobacterium melibiosiphilum TaxID=995039 RepID=A0A3A5ML93_9MICO|nr:ABC transporter permease subunit [Cryobacterium melibiosiphilum]RJT89741.1 ABC transporter permease subunit [Cryobacterium melibiosiphilum]